MMKMCTVAALYVVTRESVNQFGDRLGKDQLRECRRFICRYEDAARGLASLERLVLHMHYEEGMPLRQLADHAPVGDLVRARNALLLRFRSCFSGITQ